MVRFLMIYFGLFLECVLKTASTELCPPAEEGQSYSILRRLEHTLDEKLEIVVRKNLQAPVSTCRSNLICDDLNPSTTTTTITSLENRNYFVNFTIKYMSRSDPGLWEIKYLGLASLKISSPLFSCELKSFVKAKNVTCNEIFEDKTILKISCIVYEIYPKSRGLLLSKSSKLTNTMACTHNHTDTGQVYFVSVCQANVPFKDVPSISDNPFVSIFPNVTGKDDDLEYSVNYTLSYYREQPVVVLKNCPDVVEESAQVTCLCTPRDNMQTNVSWSSNSDNTFSINSNCLQFQAKIKHTEYVCHGRSLAGVISEPAIYRPKVYSFTKNWTCSVEKISSDFVIKCFIYRVYPPAICGALIDNKHFTDELTAKTTSHVQLPNEVYFNTECNWTLSLSDLKHKESIVKVKVYPNISGSSKDRDYLLEKKLHLIKDSSQESAQAGSLIPDEYIGPISVAAASLLILILAAILFIIVPRRKNLFSRPPSEPPISKPLKKNEIEGIYETIDDIGLYVNASEIIELTTCQTKLLDAGDYITVVDVEASHKTRNPSDESDGYFSQEESVARNL